MCGIAAIVRKRPLVEQGEQEDLKEALNAMVNTLKHRGPNSSGFFLENGIGIGMARLSIVGGESGVQPIWNEDHSIAVVCNGEIYNYHELHIKLESHGHVFSTSSDVEVIVHLYEQYGEDCVKHLEGIFAFAIWDSAREKLFVARDRFGVKPLYYTETKKGFLFASELRTLLVHPGVNAEIDDAAFTEYHMFRFVPGNKTIVTGIRKLQPAECAVYSPDRQPIHHFYWSATDKNKLIKAKMPFKKKAKQLKQYLYDAVLGQEATYVKSGILLSGGLDSSALLAMHHNLFGTVPDTFTVSFTPPREITNLSEYNEIENAAGVAEHFGAKHISGVYTPEQVLFHLPKIISDLDEPIADPTAIPLWFACRLAYKSGIKVLFSGEGLDELFNGYSVYQQVYWIDALKKVPESLRRTALQLVHKLGLPGAGVLRKSLLPVAKWYQGVGGTFQEYELKRILTDVHEPKVDELWAYVQEVLRPTTNGGNNSTLHQMTLFDILTWLPENTLAKSDKISMAHSIELRVPFLDRQIVEYALEMDKHDKLHRKTGKWIVRNALSDVVPKEVLSRKKAGFPVPLTAWMFNEWKEFAITTLLSPNANTKGIYEQREIEALFNSPLKERKRSARLLWTLLCYEIWLNQVHSTSVRSVTIDTPIYRMEPRPLEALGNL